MAKLHIHTQRENERERAWEGGEERSSIQNVKTQLAKISNFGAVQTKTCNSKWIFHIGTQDQISGLSPVIFPVALTGDDLETMTKIGQFSISGWGISCWTTMLAPFNFLQYF